MTLNSFESECEMNGCTFRADVALKALSVEKRFSRFSIMGWCEEDDPLSIYRERAVCFRIRRPDGSVVAEGHLTVWTCRGLADGVELYEVADSVSSEAEEFACAILDCWSESPGHPLEYGDIVIFSRLKSTAASSEIAELWDAINRIIATSCRRPALLMLKAFPLEFEGKGDLRSDVAFERRLVAMERHYHHRLGVGSLIRTPTTSIMWKPLRWIPQPQICAKTSNRWARAEKAAGGQISR